MIAVVVGQKIPLTLQVFDGNPNLIVEAILTDNYGKEFIRAKLQHTSLGLYSNFDIEMPDVLLLMAQYVTDKPEDYEIAQDIFKAIPKPKPKEEILVGEVVSKSQSDDIVIGVVSEVQNDEEKA